MRALGLRCAAALTCSAVLAGLGAWRVEAAGPTVTGAGSTWVQIALDQWRADIARQGYAINYQGVGSSAGRDFFIINQVDFAATEIPFQPDELAQVESEHKSFQYMPDVAGGTSMMYNLHDASGNRITNLQLDADATAKLFTGAITSWQDPEIRSLNPGVQISESSVVPVIRSDGSGTSAQLSLYLASQAAGPWNAFVGANGCPAPCSQWPPFPGSTQQKGSDGVANFVSNSALGPGSVGYVEAGYAFGRNFPVAYLKNASGHFVLPTADNVATALRHATLHPDLTQDLSGVYAAPDTSAYPMSSYSYLITPTTGFDPAKGAVLGTWLIYIACAGQREAAPLGYSPLPPNLVQVMFDGVRRIPGAPAPPPIDKAHCPNPTVTGESTGQVAIPGGGPGVAGPPVAPTAGSGPSAGGADAASGNAAAAAAGTQGSSASASTAQSSAASVAAGDSPTTGNSAAAVAARNAGIASSGGQAVGVDGKPIETLTDEQRRTLLAEAASSTRIDLPTHRSTFIVAAILVAALVGPLLFLVGRDPRKHDR